MELLRLMGQIFLSIAIVVCLMVVFALIGAGISALFGMT